MAKSDAEAAIELAETWEREAYELDRLRDRGGVDPPLSPLEAKMLGVQATSKRAHAQQLKLLMRKVRRG
jgi:hypothetical protein